MHSRTHISALQMPPATPILNTASRSNAVLRCAPRSPQSRRADEKPGLEGDPRGPRLNTGQRQFPLAANVVPCTPVARRCCSDDRSPPEFRQGGDLAEPFQINRAGRQHDSLIPVNVTCGYRCEHTVCAFILTPVSNRPTDNSDHSAEPPDRVSHHRRESESLPGRAASDRRIPPVRL